MQLYGPSPAVSLLLELSNDKNEIVRAKAADLMGIYSSDETRERLLDLLEDTDRNVRRRAMEALVRAQQTAPPDTLIPLLASDDRFESWAARRLLELSPPDQWQTKILSAENHRVFINGALALLIAHPSEENAMAVINRVRELMLEFVSDHDFIDMLRVLQVAMLQGHIAPDQLGDFRDQLADEFPAGDSIMNRELVRLLVYLQTSSIMDRYFDYLHSDAANPDKVHLAIYLRFLKNGWTTERKMELFQILAEAKQWDGGSSYPLYLGNAARDFAKNLTTEESIEILPRGAEMPDAALGALYKLPQELDENLHSILINLDKEVDQRSDSASKQLMVGIVAILARSGDDASMEYLRAIWDRNPERREPVAMGLAQAPQGANWEYLVKSLPVLENMTARVVLRRLQSVDRATDDPEYIRQVLLCGLRLQKAGADDAIALLESWTGEQLGEEGDTREQKLARWQEWFARSYPDLPPATLPVDSEGSKWKFDELYDFLSSDEGMEGDPTQGASVFEKATCNKCHRYGDRGEAMGPDLTSLTSRFTRKEILQSILYPSHVISSQYVSKNLLLMDGRQIAGIVAPGPSGEKTVLTSEGEKITIPEADIDEVNASTVSAMPDGLLKDLTQEDIANLFAYISTDPGQTVAKRPSDNKQVEEAPVQRK